MSLSKSKYYNKGLKTTVLFILLSLIFTGRIIPDKQNPLLISIPSSIAEGSTISLNFQLPVNTKGLHFNQFIVVRFPKSDSAVTNLGTSNFKFDQSNSSSCKLYKDASTPIAVTWIQSSVGEENIVYCKIIDESISNSFSFL